MTQAAASPLVIRNDDGSNVTLDYMYTPAPPVVRTLFGDTPRAACNAAGLAEIDSAYDAGTVVRWYFTGAPGAIPTDRKVIVSFKTLMPATGLASLNGALRRFWMHEIDHQILVTPKPPILLPAWKIGMQAMGLTDICLTADCFVNPNKNPADYLVPGVTHVGVDFDGISGGTAYHDYSAALAAVVKFCTAHGLTWGVPEFGTDRQGWDGDGSARAAWLISWAGKFRAAGAEYVCVWEQTAKQPLSTFTMAAERTAVRAILALG